VRESAGPERPLGEVKAQLALIDTGAELDMSTFSLQKANSHEFIIQAELHFWAGASLAGYTQAQIASLTPRIRDNFSTCLDQVLADAKNGEKLAPFREYLNMDAPERRRAFRALQQHLDYQRWLYEEAPVLGKSPFALKRVCRYRVRQAYLGRDS